MLPTLTLRAAGAPLETARTRRVRVQSAVELRQALREARDRPLALDASGLACLLRTDDTRGFLEVQGGISWSALARGLGDDGERLLAPWVRSAGLPATVGQALSTDAAGPDGAPFATCIESLALATLDGELRRIDREHQGELLRLVIGGQGLFGLIYSVTVRIDALVRAAECTAPPIEIELSGPERSGGTGDEIETLLPPGQVDAFVQAARALAAERRFILRRVTVRCLRQGTEGLLGWATREWAGVTLRLERGQTLGASVHAAEVRRCIHAEAIDRGGSFPARAALGVSRAQLQACYPQLPAFLAEKRRYDPADRLQNAWYRSVTALLRNAPCESRWGD